MNRNRLTHQRDMGRIDGFARRADAVVRQAGPPSGPSARIVPVNGGFELQEAKIMTSGRWEYRRVAWSRDRRDVEQSARLRGLAP